MAEHQDLSLQQVTGIILAGGRGSRMAGEDKGLILLNGKPLYQHVLTRLQPQVIEVQISANRHQEEYQLSGCAVFSDTLPGFAGPLAGMLSALQRSRSEWTVFLSCDTPFIPLDMVEKLWQGKHKACAAWVKNQGRDHPTHVLLHRSVVSALEDYLHRGDRKLLLFLKEIGGIAVPFECDQAFMNMNTPEDLAGFQ